MKTESAYVIGTHPYSFRKGEMAIILGLKIITPDEGPPRPCFHIMFDDGQEDYRNIEGNCNYEIGTREQMLKFVKVGN